MHFTTRLGHCKANDLDDPKGETFGSLSLIADDRSASPMRNDVTYITESSGPYGVNQNQTGCLPKVSAPPLQSKQATAWRRPVRV